MKRPILAFLRAVLLLALFAALPLSIAILYYAIDVRVASNETAALVASAWQRHGKRVPLTDLTPAREEALLAIEDPSFFRHQGVDLTTPGAGMTTITQALVKLLYFPDGFQQGIAKVRQTLIARYVLDERVSKEEQLELFLNIAYMGSHIGKPIHGFARAATAYFGKDFTSLTEQEFKSLVAMLMAPNRFVPGSPAHTVRMQRMEAYLSGAYRPVSVLDVEYDGKTGVTLAEEVLIAVLRIATVASSVNQ